MPASTLLSPRVETPAPRNRWLRWTLRLAGLAVFAGFAFEIVRMTAFSNTHTVLEGKVYRSAQPTPEYLRWAKETLKLNSVINLRGGRPGDFLYDQESKACKDLGIQFYCFEFSAVRLPQVSELRLMVKALEAAPQPILFHCKQGADRTGWPPSSPRC